MIRECGWGKNTVAYQFGGKFQPQHTALLTSNREALGQHGDGYYIRKPSDHPSSSLPTWGMKPGSCKPQVPSECQLLHDSPTTWWWKPAHSPWAEHAAEWLNLEFKVGEGIHRHSLPLQWICPNSPNNPSCDKINTVSKEMVKCNLSQFPYQNTEVGGRERKPTWLRKSSTYQPG